MRGNVCRKRGGGGCNSFDGQHSMKTTSKGEQDQDDTLLILGLMVPHAWYLIVINMYCTGYASHYLYFRLEMCAGYFFCFGVGFVSPFVFWIYIGFGETTLVSFGFGSGVGSIFCKKKCYK